MPDLSDRLLGVSPRLRTARGARYAVAALTAAVLVVLAAVPAGAMTITWVRHGESEGNASGYINTTVPGPALTPLGQDEAEDVAEVLDDPATYGVFDNLYASTMIRTQQTAQPLADELGMTPVVIGTYDPATPQSNAGIQEIYAGIFEGTSQEGGIGRLGYAFIPLGWALGLRFLRFRDPRTATSSTPASMPRSRRCAPAATPTATARSTSPRSPTARRSCSGR